MTVGTFEEYWLAVDQNLCVFEFNLAETYFDRNHFIAALHAGTQGI